jgi:hypothetical protein
MIFLSTRLRLKFCKAQGPLRKCSQDSEQHPHGRRVYFLQVQGLFSKTPQPKGVFANSGRWITKQALGLDYRIMRTGMQSNPPDQNPKAQMTQRTGMDQANRHHPFTDLGLPHHLLSIKSRP